MTEVNEPTGMKGYRPPLFERLADDNSNEMSQRILSVEELEESVRREVSRLLNTRCSRPAHEIEQKERSVLDYGIPDYYAMTTENHADQEKLGEIVASAIMAFEPRLQNVTVTVERYHRSERRLWVRLDACIVVESVVKPVSFPVEMRRQGGTSEAYIGA